VSRVQHENRLVAPGTQLEPVDFSLSRHQTLTCAHKFSFFSAKSAMSIFLLSLLSFCSFSPPKSTSKLAEPLQHGLRDLCFDRSSNRSFKSPAQYIFRTPKTHPSSDSCPLTLIISLSPPTGPCWDLPCGFFFLLRLIYLLYISTIPPFPLSRRHAPLQTLQRRRRC
jgi:hypothetical protein